MLRNIIFYLLFLLQFFCFAYAKIDVVYPSQDNVKINASSAFILGNTDYGARVFINSVPVKLWQGNFFVEVVPLKYGKNVVNIVSKGKNATDTVNLTITRNKPAPWVSKKFNFVEKPQDKFLYSKTIKNNATVREKSTAASSRVNDLQENTILYLSGNIGDYYKIQETGNTEFWIHKSNISEPVVMNNRIKARLNKTKHYSDTEYDYSKFYLSHPVLYTLKQDGNKIKLILYGVETENSDGTTSANFEYTFIYDTPITGFDGYYDYNNFIYRHKKIPPIDSQNPLKDIKIFVDPGHGGVEKGAIGPTRVCEKDINLKIAKYLIQALKDSGAQVYTSREDDSKINLSDRVKKAKDNDAFISISIHNNSLPNGKDPYISHGTEVHYYNENAKNLADIIQKNLVKDLNLKDNGIHKSSFALNRSTNPVSVLVETAYIINPEEYILLQNDNFQKNIAKSIKKSLEQYILSIK